MGALCVIGILLALYIFVVRKASHMEDPYSSTGKFIQGRINSMLCMPTCTQVMVSPIGFIYDDFPPESPDNVPRHYLVTANIVCDDFKDEFSTMIDTLSNADADEAAEAIAMEVLKRIDELTIQC